MIVNTLAQPSPPLKANHVNSTTIPHLHRLSATLMSVDEGEGSKLSSNEQEIAILAPVGNT
jgi:hypothetical protein